MTISGAAGKGIVLAALSVTGIVAAPADAQTLGNRFELFGTVTTSPGPPTPFDTLVRIDPITGVQTPAGPIGAPIGVNQLDADPLTGMLFGTNVSSPRVVYRIDPATGLASVEANVGVAVNAVAFAPDGTLFGVDWSDFSTGNVLGIVDLTTQAFRPVMRLDAGFRVDAIDFSPTGILFDPQPYATTVLRCGFVHLAES